MKTGESVYIGVRPEDVEIHPAHGAEAPSGMIGGKVEATLFVGERIEYQVEVDGQGVIMIYGERHKPVDEGSKVWLKLRPDGVGIGLVAQGRINGLGVRLTPLRR